MVNSRAWCVAHMSHGHGGLGERERECVREKITLDMEFFLFNCWEMLMWLLPHRLPPQFVEFL